MGDDAMDDPATWVDRHGDGLYRYALLRLRDPDRAAEAVQETFLHALRSRAAFAGRSSEWTWLVGILRHKVVDQMRATGRRRAMIDGLEAAARARSEFDRAGRWRVGPAAWPSAPGGRIEADEFRDAFDGCLARLPTRLADAFLLRELDGLAAAEVQERLGITPANLWARLHRARSLLRQCLEGDPAESRAATASPANRKARPPDAPHP